MSDDKLKLIQDIELDNLNDENDFLETRKYSDTLQEIIKTTHTPCTIGLFGEWGSGKSSIIRDVINKFNNYGVIKEKVSFVVYDAWKYSHDSFRRTFLLEVAKQFNLEKEEEFKCFYANISKDEAKTNLNWIAFIVFAVIMLCVIIFVDFSNPNKILPVISLASVISFIASGLTLLEKIIVKSKTTINNLHLFAPEQFEELFKKLKDKIFSKDKPDKLVIVIDNLDRCSNINTTLQDIKNFLGLKDVVFIIPVDESKAWSYYSKSEELRKIFNTYVYMKGYQSSDLSIFADKILKTNNLKELQPDTKSIVIREYASNPRRIIHFFNNFQIECDLLKNKKNIKRDFVKDNEPLIAFLLILREEYGEIFQNLFNNVDSLKELLSKKLEPPYTTRIEDVKLKKFLQYTKLIWINAKQIDIDFIIYNRCNNENITSLLLNAIENDDFMSINLELDYQNTMNFLIDKLTKALELKAFKTEVKEYFKKIILFHGAIYRKDKNFKHSGLRTNLNKIYLLIDEILSEHIDILLNDNNDSLFKFMYFNKKYNINNFASLYEKELIKQWDKYKADSENIDDKNKEELYNQIDKFYKEGFEEFISFRLFNSSNLDILKDYFLIHSKYNDFKPYLQLELYILEQMINTDILRTIYYKIDKLDSNSIKILFKLNKYDLLDKFDGSIIKDLIGVIYRLNISNYHKKANCVKYLLKNKFKKRVNLTNLINQDFFTILVNEAIQSGADKLKTNFEYLININHLYDDKVVFSKSIKEILESFKNIETNVLNELVTLYLDNILEDIKTFKGNLVYLNIIKDFISSHLELVLEIKKYIYLNNITHDSVVEEIKDDIYYDMYEMFKNINEELFLKMQEFYIDLHKKVKLDSLIYENLKRYKDKHSQLTEEFKETFFKGEAL